MRLPIARIDLYIWRKIAVPFTATVLLSAMLLLLERMLRLFDFVVNQDGPAELVWQMLAHLVPHYLSLALPLGLVLGTVLAFRSLSLSSEIDAFMAGGAGLIRMARPVLVFALLLVAFDVWLVGFQQPVSRYAYRNLEFELRSGALGASIEVGDFVSLGRNLDLRVGGSRGGGQELTDVFLRRGKTDGGQTVATARRGEFFATRDRQSVILRLFDGRLLDFSAGQRIPTVLAFEAQDFPINLPEIEEFRQRGGEEREMTLPELDAAVTHPVTGERERSFQAQYHWRLLHIAILFAIPFLGIALGLTDRRRGGAGGVVVAAAALITYNELTEFTERQVASGAQSPWTSIWLLFAVFLATSLALFLWAALTPGRGVAGLIDRVWEAVCRPLKRVWTALRGAPA